MDLNKYMNYGFVLLYVVEKVEINFLWAFYIPEARLSLTFDVPLFI